MAEPLALLLLPAKLEDFELAAHARDLLEIPRAVALEPPRMRQFGVLAEMLTARYARRVKLPGDARVIILYHPWQYPLARALLATREAELWYVQPDRGTLSTGDERRTEGLRALDDRAAERATEILVATRGGDPGLENEPLRRRLLELGVISARPFVPGARIDYR